MSKQYGVQFTLTKAEVRAIKADGRNDRNAFERDNVGFDFSVEFEPINDTHTTMEAYVWVHNGMSELEVKSEMERRFNKKADFVF